jgi:hypothetical protein
MKKEDAEALALRAVVRRIRERRERGEALLRETTVETEPVDGPGVVVLIVKSTSTLDEQLTSFNRLRATIAGWRDER